MAAVLFVMLLVVPFVELYVIVQVAQGIGVAETILLLILISVAGAWLLRQQGTATWRRLQFALSRGEVPTNEVTDGALILFGGALLLTPGFITDFFGLALLLPPTRAVIKGTARRTLGRWARRRAGSSRVYVADVTRTVKHDRAGTGEGEAPPTLPQVRSDEDDSPGRK